MPGLSIEGNTLTYLLVAPRNNEMGIRAISRRVLAEYLLANDASESVRPLNGRS